MNAGTEATILEWGYWVHSTLGAIHAGAAMIALMIGPIILWRRKGDRVHRSLGIVFSSALLVVDTTALLTFNLTGGFNLFHALAVLSLAALLPGLLMIALYRLRRTPAYLATRNAWSGHTMACSARASRNFCPAAQRQQSGPVLPPPP